MKRLLAGSCTAVIMGLTIWASLGRSPSLPHATTDTSGDSGFQDGAGLKEATACIEGMLAGVRTGDVASYLAAFGGPLRERLEREAGEHGRDTFALRLRHAGEARKSHAVFAPEPDGERPDAARILVESTFADRLERQTFRLERSNGRWLVTAVEPAREEVPSKPLGALATYNEPEGVPVDREPDSSGNDTVEN